MSSRLTVWGRTSSSNTQKVLWTLAELQLQYAFIPASARLGPSSELLGERQVFGVVGTPEYGELNPHQMIPTLRDELHDGTVVWESNTIVRYLSSKFGPALHGGSAEGMAVASGWMDWVLHGSNFAPSFGSANHHLVDQIARTAPKCRDLDIIVAAHNEYLACLAPAERHLASNAGGRRNPAPGGGGGCSGPFITGGGELSVGDIPLAVELNRWSLCVHRARADGLDLECPPLPALDAYYRRMLDRQAFEEQVFANECAHQALNGSDTTLRGLPSTT